MLPPCVALVGALSALLAAHSALAPNRSQDFQWSGTRMLLDHVDPWMDFLRGDPLHRILLLQIPNYLSPLYLLLAPLGLLPFPVAKAAWVVCNLIFAVSSVWLAGRFYGLRGRLLLVASGMFLGATCMRDTLGNGQHGLMVLLLWCLALLSVRLTNGRAAAAGISYFKFSFAPPLALFLLLKGGVRAVLWSLLVPVATTVVVWLWLTGGHDPAALLRLVAEPFQVGSRGFFLRGADINLPDVLDLPLRGANLSLHVVDVCELAASTVVCAAVFFFGIVRAPRTSTQYQVALMALCSFLLFRHHNYDQVVLLLPLCYALARWRMREAQGMLLILACPFYMQRVVESARVSSRWLFLPEFVLLLLAGALLYRLRDTPEPQFL